MATTSPDNLKTPDSGDPYALVQDLGAFADTVQNALVKRGNSYVGTSAQRTAFTAAVEGTHWQDTNGGKAEWVRQGGVWVTPGGDTGWVSCPLSAGQSGSIFVRKVNGVVYFKGETSQTANYPTASSGVVVFTLPNSTFQPPSYFRTLVGAYGSPTGNSTIAIFSASSNQVTVFGTGGSHNTAYFAHVNYRTD